MLGRGAQHLGIRVRDLGVEVWGFGDRRFESLHNDSSPKGEQSTGTPMMITTKQVALSSPNAPRPKNTYLANQ